MVVDYTAGSSVLTSVQAKIATGYDAGHWDGSGIRSSIAPNDPQMGGQFITGLGVIDNNFGGISLLSSFQGRSVGLNSVLVRYTYYGDTNLDGMVDGSDYTRIDSSYALLHDANPGNDPAITWLNGDFNYDGQINGGDYALIDTAYAFQNGQPMTAAFIQQREAQFGDSYAVGLVQAVPEPGSAALLALGGLCLGFRRRKRRTE
jgi:hypothetical protein